MLNFLNDWQCMGLGMGLGIIFTLLVFYGGFLIDRRNRLNSKPPPDAVVKIIGEQHKEFYRLWDASQTSHTGKYELWCFVYSKIFLNYGREYHAIADQNRCTHIVQIDVTQIMRPIIRIVYKPIGGKWNEGAVSQLESKG